MDYRELGQQLKASRIESGKTLREFCIENNLDPVTYSRIERGYVTEPDPATAGTPPKHDKRVR